MVRYKKKMDVDSLTDDVQALVLSITIEVLCIFCIFCRGSPSRCFAYLTYFLGIIVEVFFMFCIIAYIVEHHHRGVLHILQICIFC